MSKQKLYFMSVNKLNENEQIWNISDAEFIKKADYVFKNIEDFFKNKPKNDNKSYFSRFI